jgi:hypothetical protein
MGARQRTRAVVEVGHVGAPQRDHRHLILCGRLPPVLDHAPADVLGALADHDATVALVLGERVVGATLAQVVEGLALPRLLLAAVVGQFIRVSA